MTGLMELRNRQTTIYNKLIADFTPNTPKYVFQGISEFAVEPPEIITGDNYESGRGVRKRDLFGESAIHINIFNISKITSLETPKGAEKTTIPRFRRLQENIGESYFEYLSKLDDLVLLMDEPACFKPWCSLCGSSRGSWLASCS